MFINSCNNNNNNNKTSIKDLRAEYFKNVCICKKKNKMISNPKQEMNKTVYYTLESKTVLVSLTFSLILTFLLMRTVTMNNCLIG